MRRLTDKVALVTGGASGLGKAIAQRLAEEGARVVITDIERELGVATANEHGFTFYEHDVCDEGQWVATIEKVEKLHSHLHILVNNAGIVGPMGATNPENTSLALWRRLFAVNVESVFLGCRAAIPAMRRAGVGSIINISSVAGLLATPYNTAYGATKATVRQLTKSVAQHCAQEQLNIRCNSVHPGDVHTTGADKSAKETAKLTGISVQEIIKQQELTNPMGGYTHASDVAAAVAYLASDDARRVSGTKVIVDGGLIGCDSYHLMMRNSVLSKKKDRGS